MPSVLEEPLSKAKLHQKSPARSSRLASTVLGLIIHQTKVSPGGFRTTSALEGRVEAQSQNQELPGAAPVSPPLLQHVHQGTFRASVLNKVSRPGPEETVCSGRLSHLFLATDTTKKVLAAQLGFREELLGHRNLRGTPAQVA